MFDQNGDIIRIPRKIEFSAVVCKAGPGVLFLLAGSHPEINPRKCLDLVLLSIGPVGTNGNIFVLVVKFQTNFFFFFYQRKLRMSAGDRRNIVGIESDRVTNVSTYADYRLNCID